GLAHLLRPVPVLVLTAAIHGLGIWRSRSVGPHHPGPLLPASPPSVREKREKSTEEDLKPPLSRPVGGEAGDDGVGGVRVSPVGAAFIATAAITPLVLPALYPPTAFAATLSPLPFARAFVESGGVPYLLDRRTPVFPQVNEILFAAVMMFGPDVAAHGVQLLM